MERASKMPSSYLCD
ncbi:hypothetical protein OM219_15235 [Escherichia albertii]|nr:hypothetical protein [Escherichia albertii]